MAYLCEKRNEHYHLNHFNIHQLTYLCQMVSSSEFTDFPDQVYQLLSNVAPNVSAADITSCLEEVTRIDDQANDDIDYVVNGDFLLNHFIKHF